MVIKEKLSAKPEPQISVIIATLNEDAAFLATVESCLDQKGVDLEVVSFIYDPAHDISSPAIQREVINGKQLIKIRAKDRGIADAWNTAVQSASGQFIVFLGAGDVFFFSRSIDSLFEAVSKVVAVPVDTVIIGTQFVRKSNCNLQYWKPCGDPASGGLLLGMAIPHASSFWPRGLLLDEKFDRSFKIALDYEYAIRVKDRVKYVSIACPIAIIEPGGLSNAPSRMIQVIMEDVKARRKNGLASRYISIINLKRLVRWLMGKLR